MPDRGRPLTHDWIWAAIDTIASRKGLTPSGLARLAGLDPTTFNRSKRFTGEGRPRWPSTESISKLLEATKVSLDEFACIEVADGIGVKFDERDQARFIGLSVVGEVRDAVVPDWQPPPASVADTRHDRGPQRRLAFSVSDSSLEPVYSRGNTLVVSEAAEPRPGDRILLQPAGGQLAPCLLLKTTLSRIEFGRLGDRENLASLDRADIAWMARIVLVRQ